MDSRKQAGPGALDPSFFNGMTLRNPDSGRDMMVTAVALDPQGRALVSTYLRTEDDSFIFRLLDNGLIDPTYGDNGFCRLPRHDDNLKGSPVPTKLVVSPDGSVTVVGFVYAFMGDLVYTVPASCRVLADGTLDTSYATDGLGLYPPLASRKASSAARRRALRTLRHASKASGLDQSRDGVIFVQDCRDEDTGSLLKICVLRVRPDGSLDTSYGDKGFAGYPFPAYEFRPFDVDRKGQLLMGGSFADRSYVARLTASGRPDPTFGRAGYALIAEPPGVGSRSMRVRAVNALDDGGMLVLSEISQPGIASSSITLTRLTRYGTKDGRFATSIVDVSPHGYSARLVAIDDGGRPLVVGQRMRVGGPEFYMDIAVTRFLPNGSVDRQFGENGTAVHEGVFPADAAIAQGVKLFFASNVQTYPPASRLYRLLG